MAKVLPVDCWHQDHIGLHKTEENNSENKDTLYILLVYIYNNNNNNNNNNNPWAPDFIEGQIVPIDWLISTSPQSSAILEEMSAQRLTVVMALYNRITATQFLTMLGLLRAWLRLPLRTTADKFLQSRYK